MKGLKKADEYLFDRQRLVQQAEKGEEWDIIVIGGGATGLGVALDAVSRGYKTLLLEQADFAKGTSSKSTKLVHGGVRYLAQGNISLVREALYERGLLLRNAPHLVKNQTFIIPNYEFWRGPFYWIGMKLYDLLAGRLSLGKSVHVSKASLAERMPSLNTEGLYGGVLYHDGQFDDSRMAVNIAQTCIEQGATLLNYFAVNGLLKDVQGKVNGVTAADRETGKVYRFRSRAVVNATGIFVNRILQMDRTGNAPLVRPSQGAHIVLDGSFLKSADAIMIPKTPDGRVLFAIPWHGRVIVGTTDIPVETETLEPKPLDEEISYLLETSAKYLSKPPRHEDVLSVYAGLRPLAASGQEGEVKTKEISRSHKILVESSGLLTITGGKWTTFRKMGQDVVDRVIVIAQLPVVPSASEALSLHGALAPLTKGYHDHLNVYGTDRPKIEQLMADDERFAKKLHPELEFTVAEVIWAIRNEMARTIEDVLARRVRLLFLDARAALEAAPLVAALLAEELGKDEHWQLQELEVFRKAADQYLLSTADFKPVGN